MDNVPLSILVVYSGEMECVAVRAVFLTRRLCAGPEYSTAGADAAGPAGPGVGDDGADLAAVPLARARLPRRLHDQ